MRTTNLVLPVLLAGTVCLASSASCAETPSPDAVAHDMVEALKVYQGKGSRGGLGDIENEEAAGLKGAVNRIMDGAAATTEIYLTDYAKMTILLQLRGWFAGRTPLTPEVVAKYEARFKTIDKATFLAWRAAEERSGITVGNFPTLTLVALPFQDYLFERGEWRPGNPARALARLGSLPKEAVARWVTAAEGSRAGDFGDFAPWTLLAVEALFRDDTFQPAVFESAFPIAQKLLSQP